MSREEVQDLLAMIQAIYPNYNPPNKTAAVNAWTMALEDFNKDEVAMAFKTYMRTNTSGFAPAPGQLIEKINEITQPPELNEMEAWALVSEAIRRSGYNSVEEFAKLPPLVQKAIGLPSQLRTWALDENYNEEVVSSNFIKCYRAEMKRKKEISKMPSVVRQLIQNINRDSHLAQIDEKRTNAIKMIMQKEKRIDASEMSQMKEEQVAMLEKCKKMLRE